MWMTHFVFETRTMKSSYLTWFVFAKQGIRLSQLVLQGLDLFFKRDNDRLELAKIRFRYNNRNFLSLLLQIVINKDFQEWIKAWWLPIQYPHMHVSWILPQPSDSREPGLWAGKKLIQCHTKCNNFHTLLEV